MAGMMIPELECVVYQIDFLGGKVFGLKMPTFWRKRRFTSDRSIDTLKIRETSIRKFIMRILFDEPKLLQFGI